MERDNIKCHCPCRHFARILIICKENRFNGSNKYFISRNELLYNYELSHYNDLYSYTCDILSYDNAKRLYNECVMCSCCNRHKQHFPHWHKKRSREDDNFITTNKKRRI